MDCSSCVTNGNPLCGWCVVENKCSRQSQCQNGNSTSSTRWIPIIPSANTTTDTSSQCIVNTITPNQFLVDDQQVVSSRIISFNPQTMLFQLTVVVGGPGLPARLFDESYFCHLADSEGRFAVNVSAVEVTSNTEYTCDITNQVPSFDGVQAGN